MTIFWVKISPGPPWYSRWSSELGRSLVRSRFTACADGRNWTGPLSSTALVPAVVTVTVTAGVAVVAGAAAGVAAGAGPVADVHPEANMQVTITRTKTGIIVYFMPDVLLCIPIWGCRTPKG